MYLSRNSNASSNLTGVIDVRILKASFKNEKFLYFHKRYSKHFSKIYEILWSNIFNWKFVSSYIRWKIKALESAKKLSSNTGGEKEGVHTIDIFWERENWFSPMSLDKPITPRTGLIPMHSWPSQNVLHVFVYLLNLLIFKIITY